MLFDMQGCINVITNELFTDENCVLIVIALPVHKADKNILAERDLAVGGGCAVRYDVALFKMIADRDDRALIYAGALVGTLKLDKLVFPAVVIYIGFHDDLISGNEHYGAGCFVQHEHAAVISSLILHTGSDNGSLGHKKRHCLTLHV